MHNWVASFSPLHYEQLKMHRAELDISKATHAGYKAIIGGWLYDRDALSRLVAPVGVNTDAELLLGAYLKWGEEAFQRIRGAFAACLWDGARQQLLCFRDPLGTFPLFYTRVGREWLFSPKIQTLLQHPDVSRELNREALAASLLDCGYDLAETCFSSVRRVAPGHLLRIYRESETQKRYWSPLEANWLNDTDLVKFPNLMLQAVARPMQLGPVGVHLSGGVDSGTVATLAAEHARVRGEAQPHALSLYFVDDGMNEQRVQNGLAMALALPHTAFTIASSKNAVEVFFRSLNLNSTWPQPTTTFFLSEYLQLNLAAKRAGQVCVLTGDGADEWLAVRYPIAADFIRTGNLSGLVRLWQLGKQVGGMAPGEAAHHILWSQGIRLLLLQWIAPLFQRRFRRALKTRREIKQERTLPHWSLPDPMLKKRMLERLAAQAVQERSQHDAEVLRLLNHPLTALQNEENFESGCRAGLPIVSPFYDPDLVHFLLRMQPHQLNRSDVSKGLLRSFLHPRFPDLGYDVQVKSYADNFFGSLVRRCAPEVLPTTQSSALVAIGLVAPKTFSAYVSGIRRDPAANTMPLWRALCHNNWVHARSAQPSVLTN